MVFPRIISLCQDGLSYRKILNIISGEGFNVSTADICKFRKKYEETENMARKQESGQTSKLTNENKIPIEEKMKNEDKTSLHFHD